MARRGSTGRRARGIVWEWTDRLTILGLQVGGAAFVIVSVYLFWGIIAGSLSRAGFYTGPDLQRVLQNVQICCKILVGSSIAIIVSCGIRFYLEEVTGYILLVVGAVLRWGMPVLVGSSLRDIRFAAATLPAYVASHYSLVGTIALAAAGPFLILDVGRKLREAKRLAARTNIVIEQYDDDEEPPQARLCLFCWQMPYCRNYLRRYCTAYGKRKSCWRIKSGCYCDEEMILRMMKRSSSSRIAGSDQTYAWLDGSGKKKNLSAAEKRERCRVCAIYNEHQRHKYRILGPLAFPATVLITWAYLKPAHLILHRALQFTDKFAARLSYGATSQIPSDHWMNTPVASNSVENLFLICLGLIVLTYMIRALEYFIFDLQM